MRLLALLLAASLGADRPAPAVGAATAPAKGIPWQKNFAAAQLKAKAEKKPVMIDFWAEWCHWCHELDKRTYVDPQVVSLASGFVAVKVDAEGSRSEVNVASKYGVESLPTILFITPAGHAIVRVNGFQEATEFAGALEHARTLGTDIMGWETALAADPKDAVALAKLGAHLFDTETYEESRDLLRRAMAVDALSPVNDRKRTRTLLGIIQHFDGKFPEAEQILKEALAMKPANANEDAASLYTLGRTYLKWGKKSVARATFQKVVESYPGTKSAARAQETLDTLPQ